MRLYVLMIGMEIIVVDDNDDRVVVDVVAGGYVSSVVYELPNCKRCQQVPR